MQDGSLANPVVVSRTVANQYCVIRAARAEILSEVVTFYNPPNRYRRTYSHLELHHTMADPGYNELLKWGIQNSDVSRKDPTAPPPQPMSAAHREALQYMLAEVTGTSDADSMVQSMDVVDNPEAEAKAKYVAFDNFEMLIENIDNANNLENRSLWTRLINHLENDDAELRSRAAWCCGIAVQNNIRSQERVSKAGICTTHDAALTHIRSS